jgi:CMP-N,N'-diacetyllegionaminic acid synthase
MNDMGFLAVIPARGGSKRFPGKNIVDFAGKPLIAWTIEAALESKHINRVIVSTDNEEIARIAKQYGAEIPFLRPSELATDTATSISVIEHLIMKVPGYEFVILLQPTSPLRTSLHIDGAIEKLLIKEADGVVSVSKVDHPVEWTNVLPEDDSMDNFVNESLRNTRSQDLTSYYRLNGAIYIGRTVKLQTEKSFLLTEKSFAYKMKQQDSIDIDDEYDLLIALIIKIGLNKSKKLINLISK